MMTTDSDYSSPEAIVRRFYTALANKDLAAARSCCSKDARFWHCFDGVAQDLTQAEKGWEGLFAFFQENRIVDVRCQQLSPGELVQRHLFLLRGDDGVLKGKPCCIFVKVNKGVITRLDEYIDLSGDLPMTDALQHTPGLPEQGFI